LGSVGKEARLSSPASANPASRVQNAQMRCPFTGHSRNTT